jgi:hypothetical protein
MSQYCKADRLYSVSKTYADIGRHRTRFLDRGPSRVLVVEGTDSETVKYGG